jgi:malonate transporter and related proteins
MATAFLLLPDFLLIVLGYALARWSALDRPLWDGAERLVYYLLFPCLLFVAIVRQPISPGTLASLGATGLALTLLGIALAYALAKAPRIDAGAHAAGAQVAFRFNSYIALALSERLGGTAAVAAMAVLIAVVVPLCNIAAVWPLARAGGQHYGRELLRNPLILATVGGLAANLAGLVLPDVAATTLQRLGAAALPLGLMAVGAGPGRGAAGDPPPHAAGRRLAAGAAAAADDAAAANRRHVLCAADRRQRLRAGLAHGRARRVRGRAGDGLDAARHGQRADRAGAARRYAVRAQSMCSCTSASAPSRAACSAARTLSSCVARSALPSATARLRRQRCQPMRRIALPSLR